MEIVGPVDPPMQANTAKPRRLRRVTADSEHYVADSSTTAGGGVSPNPPQEYL
jgi:hypothetical protein